MKVVFVLLLAVLSLRALAWTTQSPGITVREGDPAVLSYLAGGEPWSECTLSADLPQGDLVLDLKASFRAPVVIALTFEGGGKAFYHLTVPSVRSLISMNTGSADMTEGSADGNIKAVSIAFEAGSYRQGDRAEIAVYGLSLRENGPEKTLYSHLWTPSIGAGPVEGADPETCVWNVWRHTSGPGWDSGQARFGGYDAPGGRDIITSVIDYLSLYYGHGGLDLPYVTDPSFAAYAAGKNVTIYGELHHTPDTGWLKEHRALNVNKWGQTCLDMGLADLNHAYDFTDPRVVEKTSEKLLRTAAAGVKYVRSIDYVWTPFGPGGSWNAMIWGFSAAAIQRWREDLSGRDKGIEILDGGGTRRLFFREYFTDYHGYWPEPADAGCASWEDYVPPRDEGEACLTEKNKLHNMLFHYEWLKFINEAAEPCVRQYGVYAQPILNGESAGNGGDYIYLSRLSNVAGYCPEWWGPHEVIIGNYYNGRYYERGARGRERTLWGESGAAGADPFYGRYPRPNYWDNPANCLITYSQAGSSDFRGKQDQYWGSEADRLMDPEEKEYLLYTAFISAWNGFLRAREDGLRKPETRVCAFIQRAPAGYSNSMDTRADAPWSLNGILERNNYLYDGASFPDTLGIDDYDLCFYSPVTGPRGALNMLWKWLEKGRKTLVTHSFIPVNGDRPGKDVNQIDPEPGFPAAEKAAARRTGFDTIRRTELSSGELSSELPGLEKYEGPFALEGSLYSIGGYRPLVTLGGRPLVSEKTFPNGSRIIYLGFAPCQNTGGGRVKITAAEEGVQTPGFDSAVIKALMDSLGLRPQGIAADDLSVLRYETRAKGDVYIICNRSANTRYQGEEETFTVFQQRSPRALYSAPVRVFAEKADADYVIRDVLTGEEEIGRSGPDGSLEIDMNGFNLRGVYVYPLPWQ
ncbi:MAG: hypothetical protein IK083_00785 [Abditibacteriota bacterium]|nr:hypothetical protein [Abditibacteriota bacterium]